MNIFRPAVREISKNVKSTEASELPSGQSRRLRLRIPGGPEGLPGFCLREKAGFFEHGMYGMMSA